MAVSQEFVKRASEVLQEYLRLNPEKERLCVCLLLGLLTSERVY